MKNPQSLEVNLTPQARTHYNAKMRDRKDNGIVEITGLDIPLGSVQGGITYVTPELTLRALSEQALMDFSSGFFNDEETDMLTIEREITYDVQDV